MACPAVPNSVLFLGRPGVGKTTVIREMARVLADDLHKRVVRSSRPAHMSTVVDDDADDTSRLSSCAAGKH